jgi:transcriptional regulator with XRE-family HTH domain
MRSQSPAVQLRRLGRELRDLRENSGLTVTSAGKAIGRSNSTISRLENGKRKPQVIELKGLLEAYEATDEQRDRLLGLFQDMPEEGWWTAYEDLPPGIDTYLGLEADAATLHVYALATVHSLLRTEDYSRAILRAGRPSAPDDEIEALVTMHARRQQVLQRTPTPLDLIIVLDEASLRRTIGSQEVMNEQLLHLIHCSQSVPNVTLHVLPLEKGAHGSLNGSFTILDFPDAEEPSVVYVDSPGAISTCKNTGTPDV